MAENDERVVFVNLYTAWELYWPADVTFAQLRSAANDGEDRR